MNSKLEHTVDEKTKSAKWNVPKCIALGLVLLLIAYPGLAENVLSQSVNVKMTMNNTTVADVVKELHKQTGYEFSYESEILNKRVASVSVNAKNEKIEKVLTKVFSGTDISFRVLNNRVFLKQNESKTKTVSAQEGANAQQQQGKTITGTILDANGEPVIGATVVVQGDASKGTVTDIDGNYTLTNVPENATLVVSYVGMQTQNVSLDGRSSLNLTLAEDTELLDEVVIVGYGVQKKVNLTGAVSSVSGKDFEQRPLGNAALALQGLVPGLTISTSSAGTPGGETSISLRGQGNLSGTGTPYVLVDGVEMSLADVNPNDIENISVLKDAAASAIYGARAAYGVILVTTKRGKEGQARISYQGNTGWSTPTVLPDMVDSYDFALFWNDGVSNSGSSRLYSDAKLALLKQFSENPSSVDPWQELSPNATMNPAFENSESGIGNTDYFDLHYKDWAFKHNHNLSVSGGGEKAQYYISGGMYNEDGILRYADMGYQRFNITANTTAKVTNWLKATINTKFVNSTQDSPFGEGGISYGFFHSLARFRPTVHYLDPNGNFTELSMIPYLQSGSMTQEKNNSFDITTGLQVQPVENWFINFDYTYKQKYSNYDALNVAPLIYGFDGVSTSLGARAELGVYKDGKYTKSKSQRNYQSMNLYSNYSFSFSDHNFSVLAGYQEELFNYNFILNSITGLLSTSNPNVSMGTGDKVVTDTRYSWATRGFFGRINYDYLGKYLLELNGRYDGSSRFASDHRWGFFPSASVGWNIHREEFMSEFPTLSNLKLRASYGLLGNQAGAANYTFAATMGLSDGLSNYIFADGRQPYINAPGVVDPTTTWEKVTSSNIGLDFGFFSNALTGSFDIFQRDTKDMLGPGLDFPDYFGASAPQSNNASLRNRGWEFAINYRGSIKDEITYSIGATIFDATTVITKYQNPTGTNPSGNWYVGKNVGEIWGYKADGIIQSQEEANSYNSTYDLSYISSVNWKPGDVKLKDNNGDNKVNRGTNTIGDMGDMEIIGNTTARLNYTFNGALSWRDISLSMMFQGVGKRDWWPGGSIYFWGSGAYAQVTVFPDHLNYWREDNPDAYYPNPYIHTAGGVTPHANKNKQVTDRYLQNASYLRLKTITLSYNIPTKLYSRFNVDGIQVYLTGENLLTITALAKMFDPEGIFTFNSYTSEGGKNYPMNKVLSAGIVINL